MLSERPLSCNLAGIALARASAVVYSLSPALVLAAVKAVKDRKGFRLLSEKYSIFASFSQLLQEIPCLKRPSFEEERPTDHGHCWLHSRASLFWSESRCSPR
jgi:hypothetical protein